MPTTDPPGRDRFRFLARYGEAIMRGGIAAIPAALYRYQGELRLSPQQVWFISSILVHKWDEELPSPSLKRMAEQTGVSRVSLHKYQAELVAAGWLKVINRRGAEGGKDTNFYDFEALFSHLAQFLDRDKRPRSEDSPDGSPSRGAGNVALHGDVNPSLHGDVNPPEHGHVNPGLHEKESVVSEAVSQESGVYLSNSKERTRKKFPENVVQDDSSGPASRRALPAGFARIGSLLHTPASPDGEPRAAAHPAAVPPPQEAPSKPTGSPRSSRTQKAKKGAVPAQVEQSDLLTQSDPQIPISGVQVRKTRRSATPAPAAEELAELTYTIQEISDKLADSRHWRSNLTQARRILEVSGLNHNAWTALIWSVYHRTAEQQGRLAKPAAWFFTALRQEAEQRTSGQQSLTSALAAELAPQPRMAGRYAHLVNTGLEHPE